MFLVLGEAFQGVCEGLIPTHISGAASVTLLEWRGAFCRLGCQWSHTNVLTPDFSTKLSQFIKYSLSCGQDFNREDTSFRFDHPTMAFLGQALGNSKNLWCQLRISRFGFPFFFNIYFFLYQL